VNQVIAMLEDDLDFSSANIYVQPPENSTGQDTDEDSGSEDGGGSLNDLTGRQLRAEASATIFSSNHQKTVISDAEGDTDTTELADS